jgi:hypothetical protein
MARLSNFTDAQKAELYVRHRATCVYSGEKLWILDGGASPHFVIDWADHIFPVSKGGLSTLENGVCASWYHNSEKGNKTEVPGFLFYEGKPTKLFHRLYISVPRAMARDLKRFAKLHSSDWYFNRALFRVLLGVDYLHNGIGVRTRDDLYYSAAALKAISKWRKIVLKEEVATLEERGLVSGQLLPDQLLLLDVREAVSVGEIRKIMKRLLPTYGTNTASP